MPSSRSPSTLTHRHQEAPGTRGVPECVSKIDNVQLRPDRSALAPYLRCDARNAPGKHRHAHHASRYHHGKTTIAGFF